MIKIISQVQNVRSLRDDCFRATTRANVLRMMPTEMNLFWWSVCLFVFISANLHMYISTIYQYKQTWAHYCVGNDINYVSVVKHLKLFQVSGLSFIGLHLDQVVCQSLPDDGLLSEARLLLFLYLSILWIYRVNPQTCTRATRIKNTKLKVSEANTVLSKFFSFSLGKKGIWLNTDTYQMWSFMIAICQWNGNPMYPILVQQQVTLRLTLVY